MKINFPFILFMIAMLSVSTYCTREQEFAGVWVYEIEYDDEEIEEGAIWISAGLFSPAVSLNAAEFGTIPIDRPSISGNQLKGEFELYGTPFTLEGKFSGDAFAGKVFTDEESYPMIATRVVENLESNTSSDVTYNLRDSDLPAYEDNLDHAAMVANLDREALEIGARIYNANCINCHGTPEIEGSIPQSLKFWEQPFKAGNDPHSMYQTLTKGYGAMPPQMTLTPQEKYAVITYLREEYIREANPTEYYRIGPKYLANLPKGSSTGPAYKPYHPWSDMDYGNFFINTYELVDEKTGPERFHSPRPVPYADEDYLDANFAYKGIAVRLDPGAGGVSKGKAWMIFDHDLMRVAGGWTGEGFIDWDGILLNDKHETYPRTIGELHFETPVGPGWANPATGTFEDPRFRARDGRPFGPLPKEWADFKGIYHYEDHIILSYSVGEAEVLEELGMEEVEGTTIFTRTLNISSAANPLKMRVAPATAQVALTGEGAAVQQEEDYHVLSVEAGRAVNIKLFIGKSEVSATADTSAPPPSLSPYTKGGPAHYPDVLTTEVTTRNADGVFATDVLLPPFENPWNCRMKLSGIDFLEDANTAVACATDGDIWLISGLLENTGKLSWRRIGAGLFQPLGIKVVNEQIYVTCRDQIVRLQDLNGDGETDFYESFNHDHQVTDHFHEFAMGLQADAEGNLYYAKSGRHAREALIPQHGTLLKVSKDGSTTEIIATGFRAANGVCINPDGSFIVTDQQGFWNPMNRINWVQGKGNFYGNMWGYDPPADSSRAAMEPPLVWVDMEFDRSPSELVWVDSEKWGPLNGSLLSLSYGFGKIQLVYNEEVNGQKQGGVIDLPGIKFLTGVMRGRFNPEDGHLYACGMSAWGTTQMMKGGGLYRVRYTSKPLPVPVALNAEKTGMRIGFAQPLDPQSAQNREHYEVKTWNLKRTSDYGSDRYDVKTLEIAGVLLSEDGRSVKLLLPDIEPVDVMTIEYNIVDKASNPLAGKLQHTIHHLGGGSLSWRE